VQSLKEEMADKKIKCIDCNKDFIFSAGEQEFFEEKDTASQSGARTAGVEKS